MAEAQVKPAETVRLSAVEPLVQRKAKPWRHKIILLSFLCAVVLPSLLGTFYLFTRAADQYESMTAFSVKAEDTSGGFGALAAITQITTSSVPDSAILFDYIQSRTLVDKVNDDLDLITMFNRQPSDFVFSLGEDPSAEDLVDFWNRAVRVSLDTRTNILQIDVRAFTPEDAVGVSDAVIQHSTGLVNRLSSIAQDDATKYAHEELAEAEDKLKRLRLEIRSFRDDNSLIDPAADATSQIGVISALQSQLATSLVEKAALIPVTQPNDHRIALLDRRIDAIRSQIAAERAAIGKPTGGEPSLTQIIGQYEELLVDLEFAENAYMAALAAVEKARAEARRQSRYLAVHIPPALADESTHPNRWLYSGLLVLGTFALWAVSVLIFYNIRDRG